MKNKLFTDKIEHKNLFEHKTKRRVILKFLAVLFIFIVYLIIITQKYGLKDGFLVSVLTWSFFVLCTPVADAGFLIDFPLRLVTKIKMFVSEVFVWIIAILINAYAFFVNPDIYSKTPVLSLFKNIIEKPFPFWLIIFLSMIGTFLSVEFGDELLDKAKHSERKVYQKKKNSHKLIIMFFLFLVIFLLYDYLLNKLGINILN